MNACYKSLAENYRGYNMKLKAFVPILALLFLMTSSASNGIYNQTQPLQEETVVELVEFVAFESAEEDAGEPEEVEDVVDDPPEIDQADTDRTRINRPYLVQLRPYIDGTYTDGMNVFAFADDGTVTVKMYNDDQWHVLNRPDPPAWEIHDIEELKDVAYLASQNVGLTWSNVGRTYLVRNNAYAEWRVVHIENGMYYLHHEPIGGAGSGESFNCRGRMILVRINADGDFKEFERGAVHIRWHDGYFYYVDLLEGLTFTPGVGPIARMDMNGENKTVIVEDLTFGPFHISNDRVFFSCLESGAAYSVDLNGNDRQPVDERISPRYHRVWLDFYGGAVINNSWIHVGYFSAGIAGILPLRAHHPAIMCIYGRCLVVFPPELRRENSFTVLAFSENDDRFLQWSNQRYFLILQSDSDESLWAYHTICHHHENSRYRDGWHFELAREQVGGQW